MSGGRFNYQDRALCTEIFGFTDTPVNVFEDLEISELIWDVFNLIHAFDWYKSGDSNREDYLKVKKEFKDKWFKDRDANICRIIDASIEQCKNELYETFGFDDKTSTEGNDI